MTRRLLPGLLVLMSSCLYPAMAAAQTAREGAAAFGVAGLVYQKAVFGDDNPLSSHAISPTLGGLVRGPRSGRTALTFEAMLQPNATQNPHYPESFAPLYLMAGAQMGRRTYMRWSGGITFVGGIAPMIGVAIGGERPLGSTWLSGAELVVRAGGGIGVAGVIAGVQFPVGAHTGR